MADNQSRNSNDGSPECAHEHPVSPVDVGKKSDDECKRHCDNAEEGRKEVSLAQ
jgi:hypothetical protein